MQNEIDLATYLLDAIIYSGGTLSTQDCTLIKSLLKNLAGEKELAENRQNTAEKRQEVLEERIDRLKDRVARLKRKLESGEVRRPPRRKRKRRRTTFL